MTSQINPMTREKFHSRVSDYAAEVTFLVVNKVSQSVPSENMDRGKLDLPGYIPLADPEFHQEAYVDGLIEAQLFWDHP